MCRGTRPRIAHSLPLPALALALLPGLLALAARASAAPEPCRLARAAELPVTMEGLQPLVHAAINGQDALFVADSGAFFSMLSPAAARRFDLPLEHAAFGFAVRGVGGDAETWVTRVKKFTIFGLDVRDVPFVVAGSDWGHGAAGLLGQNVFRVGDVEYDLANGTISIMRTHGECRKTSLAYWANARGLAYSVIDIDFATAERPHTTGEAYLNGQKIRVLFDTGASASGLTLGAARRAGVTPDRPGVAPGGTTYGIGHKVVRTWIAPFASFKIGDEEIRNTHLRISDVDFAGTDMLIGADFFLSHHILVATSQRKLYFTYNGGPVFNLTTMKVPVPAATEPGSAGDSEPAEPAAAAAANQPAEAQSLDASGYARRGSASAARHDYEHALADLTRAITLDPTQADYHYLRGMAYAADNQPEQALEDFSQAVELKPDHVDALIARAGMRARRNAPAELISADLDSADRAAPGEWDRRVMLGGLYQSLGNYPAAISQYDRWIDSHNGDDIQMPHARHARCRARALTGQGLERALDDCNAAVRARPRTASYLDSRGLVYLRQGKYDKAIADYDAALALNPKIAWSLYGRGLAKQHLGQSAAGQADVAAATALAPKIAEEAASHGVVP